VAFLKEKENELDNFLKNTLELFLQKKALRKTNKRKTPNNLDGLQKSVYSQKDMDMNLSSTKNKYIRNNTQIENKNSKNNNSALVEDRDTSLESESIQKEEKLIKRKINYIEKDVLNHLYKPTFEKSDYLRKLNRNMKMIKNMTFNYSRYNFIMKQKKKEINLIGQQMLIFNNPKLHVNELSKILYNDINNIMMNKRKLNNFKSFDKKFRSKSLNTRAKKLD
jgi:hypothetical protein